MKAILIDDELNALKSLAWEIQTFCPAVEVVNQFVKPQDALSFLKAHEVDLIFLDIEMPGMNGFQFLDHCTQRNFKVVITTAYDQYAIQAIKQHAFDYLLKPIDSDDLKTCIEKVSIEIKAEKSSLQFEKILTDFSQKNNSSFQKISFNADGKLLFFNLNDILYFKSEGNYSYIYSNKTQKKLINHNLKSVEEKLMDYPFSRIHNSFIINLSKIIEFNKAEQYIVLEHEVILPVSRNKKEELLNKL
jgi:two-component system LytT family response regulator